MRSYELPAGCRGAESLRMATRTRPEAGVGQIIDSVYEFDRAAEACARLQGASHFGKVLIRVA